MQRAQAKLRYCRAMNNYTYAPEAIKEQVSMQDAIALYAPGSTARHNRIPCPIHNGANFNLSFTDRLYHCFACGSGGDVISFTQHVFELDFRAAIDKLNADFNLGIPLTAVRRSENSARPNKDTARSWRNASEKRKRNAHTRNYTIPCTMSGIGLIETV